MTTPVLNITKRANHYVTLRCLSSYGSLPINYTFFENNITKSQVIIKNVREPAEFNVTKDTGGGEEYRCKAENRLPYHVKYSLPVTIPSTGKGYLGSSNRVWVCFQKLLPPVHFPYWPPAPKCLSFGRVHMSCDGIVFCHKNKTKNPTKPQRKPCLDLPLHLLELTGLFSFAFLSTSNTYCCPLLRVGGARLSVPPLAWGRGAPGPALFQRALLWCFWAVRILTV